MLLKNVFEVLREIHFSQWWTMMNADDMNVAARLVCHPGRWQSDSCIRSAERPTSLAARAWASRIQVLPSSLQSSPWHIGTEPDVSHWALWIKRWRHCSFSSLLSSTRRSPGSTFDTDFGDRVFAVAGPSSWNRLPATIRSSYTLQNFTNQLKACFFWWAVFFSFSVISNTAPSNWSPCYGRMAPLTLLLLLLYTTLFTITAW